MSEEQFNQLHQVSTRDDGVLLFSNKKNNISNLAVSSGNKDIQSKSEVKERKWWEPFPEYHFNWYTFRFEEMTRKQKDQQFWIDAVMVLLTCSIVISVVRYIEGFGMYGRDKFFETVSGEKVEELGKANYRKHEPPR